MSQPLILLQFKIQNLLKLNIALYNYLVINAKYPIYYTFHINWLIIL